MNKFKTVLMTMLMLTFVAGASSAADMKIGYVDLSRVFDEYYKTKDYDKVLEAKSKDFEKERNAKIEKVKEQQGKLGLLADDKKAPVEQDIEKLKTELLEYDRQQKTDLTKERNEKIREILLEIEKIVSGYAEKEGYSLILNDRVLVYGNQTMDLTEEMIKLMNQNKADKK